MDTIITIIEENSEAKEAGKCSFCSHFVIVGWGRGWGSGGGEVSLHKVCIYHITKIIFFSDVDI